MPSRLVCLLPPHADKADWKSSTFISLRLPYLTYSTHLSNIEIEIAIMVHQHGDHHDIPKEDHISRAGAWLPADHRIQHEWLGGQIDEAKKHKKDLVPVLQDFKKFIESNPRIYMYFNAM